MKPKLFGLLSAFIILFSSLLTTIASAKCLGVSRTIHVSKFNAALGTGAGGNIGLRHKEVVLTFDDGPIAGKTSRVLSALSRECTKATFFVVGRMARSNPALLRRIARSGHTIAHHTYTHANLRGGSLARAQSEIQRGIAATRIALGPLKARSSKLFRYPYLARSAGLDRILRGNGLIPFSASIMSLDWKRGSSASVVARVMNQLRRQGRGVVLMHDIQGRTASALPQLLRQMKREGYKVVHIRSGGSGAAKGVNIAALSKAEKRTKKRSRRTSSLDRRATGTNPRKTNTRSTKRTRTSKNVDSKAAKRHLARLNRMKAASLRRSKALRKKKTNARKRNRNAELSR